MKNIIFDKKEIKKREKNYDKINQQFLWVTDKQTDLLMDKVNQRGAPLLKSNGLVGTAIIRILTQGCILSK